MSLRSLLPIGRSFSPHDNRLGRYRPAEPGALPDFSDAVPRSAPPAAETIPAQVHGSIPVPASDRNSVSPTPLGAGPVGRNPDSTPSPSPAMEQARLRRHARGAASSGRRLPLWLENLLMALFGPGNRRRLSHSVQTEMDFRSVRVARNDLTASDIEAVPIRAPRAETSLSPDCRKRVLSLWFDQGSRRLRRWSSSLF